jgi:hypothetical protein
MWWDSTGHDVAIEPNMNVIAEVIQVYDSDWYA